MKGSIHFGKVFGIKVQMHWSFFLIFAYIGYFVYLNNDNLSDFFFQSMLLLAVFVCVLLHEFGHALMARRFGIHTRQIVILPIGGVAQLEKMTENPRQELLVAIAGPLVNVGIFLLLLPFLIAMHGSSWLLDTAEMYTLLQESFWFRLTLANVLLVIFNLIPAYPMDGGRIFRALLALRINYLTSTLVAARIGQLIAIGFAVAGPLLGHYLLILIGIFIFVGAEVELRIVSRKQRMKGHLVKDAMLARFATLHPLQTITQAIEELLAGSEKEFIVQEKDGEVVGVITQDMLLQAYNSLGNEAMIGSVMMTDYPRVEPIQPIEEAVQLMNEREVTIIPVFEGYTFIGAINMDNIKEYLEVSTISGKISGKSKAPEAKPNLGMGLQDSSPLA